MLNRIKRAHVIGATDAIRVKVIYPKYATKAEIYKTTSKDCGGILTTVLLPFASPLIMPFERQRKTFLPYNYFNQNIRGLIKTHINPLQ